MNKTLQIFYIYSDNCSNCERTLGFIDSITAAQDIPVQMMKFRFDEQVALQIAVKNGIDDLPGVVIGESTLQGKNILKSDLEKAILEAWKTKN